MNNPWFHLKGYDRVRAIYKLQQSINKFGDKLGKKNNMKSLSSTQKEINLTHYSSLINSTVNYPSMNGKSKKNVNFGFTHGEAFKVPSQYKQKKRWEIG